MKKILFCSSDAGGANNIIPVIHEASATGYNCIVFGSQTTCKLFEKQNIDLCLEEVNSVEKAGKILHENEIDILICATSCYLGSEQYFIEASRKKNIKSLSVLDEWFNYRIRFLSDRGELDYLPDIICCQDDRSKALAIKEGIPESILEVTGSVYLSELDKKRELFRDRNVSIPEIFKGIERPIIVFLSETHSQDYGEDENGGPFGDFLGYTEKIVRKDLFEALKHVDKTVTVLEKLHPNDRNKYDVFQDDRIDWLIEKDMDVWTLFAACDIVVGMRSMALLESALFDCPTVSYQPGRIGPQLCAAVNLGLVSCLRERNELEKWIFNNFNGKEKIRKEEFSFIKSDVPKRILELV
ncbi:MAG: hypothetical protein KKD07_00225 [Candidatus Omnitrophica bacterium]|nr:hypothetical protein [Candidatus Omnitrophota bacterium]MBU1996621.1 hypothetical protein [Candidatus Omnitrophota bacterium]MBU4332848.1 hypothetical protein [Candidatus Omnitrophota bacterium]